MSLTTIDMTRLNLLRGMRVLDVGCGEGRHTISAALEEEIDAYGIDLRLVDLATTNVRWADFATDAPGALLVTRASGFALPFADDSFDRVICSEVLEHIHDFESVLKEIDRVLKPNGLFAVSVPRYGPERICWALSRAYHEVEGGHIRIFKTKELDTAVRKRSYERLSKHFAHGLHSPYWWLRCLFWSRGEQFFLCQWYHKLLVWDLMQQPALTRFLDRILNPLIGKSVVLYYRRLGDTSSVLDETHASDPKT
ncbi:MAG: class I SAM-dependent methyltransferase [Pseudomonadaceae bacterium]|nr:class I SAM-dependent methyltransferase [Pseudomonadaceae bacterium]